MSQEPRLVLIPFRTAARGDVSLLPTAHWSPLAPRAHPQKPCLLLRLFPWEFKATCLKVCADFWLLDAMARWTLDTLSSLQQGRAVQRPGYL